MLRAYGSASYNVLLLFIFDVGVRSILHVLNSCFGHFLETRDISSDTLEAHEGHRTVCLNSKLFQFFSANSLMHIPLLVWKQRCRGVCLVFLSFRGEKMMMCLLLSARAIANKFQNRISRYWSAFCGWNKTLHNYNSIHLGRVLLTMLMLYL